ncbi:uncharacterized protein BDFB_003781 [Asbolus verrucosus]|uniref:Peptidase S1 domain-containing protein n=1 Tax=Asbolus verrucosus TaxID=1661398 RepID=A0A482VAB2_ASBVE|nr:uncharacterized protein BDFB_003781 [Asbolus verrucosus]
MNKIHSRILALVLSIFLIQAADPPVQRPSGAFIQYLPKSSNQSQKEDVGRSLTHNSENLKIFHNYLVNIKNESSGKEIHTKNPSSDSEASTNRDTINRFLQRERKTEYEKLLEKDFVRPLLKLYEKQIHREPDYITRNSSDSSRISKEDYVEDFRILSKDELNLLIHGGETYQRNHNQNTEQQITRRDDNFANAHDEHIGEILPPNYQSPPKSHRFSPIRRFYYQPTVRSRKSYEESGFKPFRKPVTFPGDRFRPEYEPSGFSSEGFDSDSAHYRPDSFELSSEESRSLFSRPTRLSLPPSDVPGYRLPRRQRGYPEGFPPTARDPYWQGSWASARRPRVIFPSDLVAFREPNGNQEDSDWLAGDNNLQDIQEQDTRDRGTQVGCASGVTCEFFLTCWLSGGLLESPCDGLLRGCCQRGASKTGQSTGLAVGTLEAPPESPKSGLLDADYRCGISSNRQQAQRRIVGGEEAGFGTFPWQAYIRIGSSRCGGSLVSRRHVVTAGHCVARATPRQVHVTLGDYVINSAVEPLPAYTFGVSQIQFEK